MKVEKTNLPGVVIIEPKSFGDDRGYFFESFHERRYRVEAGIDAKFVQDNCSRSARGVLRGLHFQQAYPQGKLVQVTQGEVFDVVVDYNPESPTFRQWVGVELSAANHRQFYVPPGYAHGFVVLSDFADFSYKCTEYYHPEDEAGIIWNDPDIDIAWPTTDVTLSPRDTQWPTLADYWKAR